MGETRAWKQAERYTNTPGAAMPRFEVGQYLMNPKSEPKGVLGDNTKIRPSRDVLVTGQHGRYGIEVKI